MCEKGEGHEMESGDNVDVVRCTLGKKNFKFSIEYSIGFLLIVFYRILANSFL